MIYVPENTKVSWIFSQMINFFNRLERDLEYPKCEGYADQRRVIEAASDRFGTLLNDLTPPKIPSRILSPT